MPEVARSLAAPRDRAAFNRALLRWGSTAQRAIEIRQAASPWEVLVGEVMSQQTQVVRIGPAWRRFIGTWPTPAMLAQATTHELLQAWAGLGYNRRALALRDAARAIVDRHGGAVPADVVALEALPGIGPYTARAIAAAAFGMPLAPLDVNVRRVMARVLGGSEGDRGLQPRADALVARRQSRRWVDAVMDLAATLCTRRDPRCDACPAAPWCVARGAASVATSAPPRSGPPFATTRRWLRGRLLATVRNGPPGQWVTVPDALGVHDRVAVVAALESLERDGLLELAAGQPVAARIAS